MKDGPFWAIFLGLAAGWFWAAWPGGLARAQDNETARVALNSQAKAPSRPDQGSLSRGSLSRGANATPLPVLTQSVPWEKLPPEVRASVRLVLEQPTLATRGPVEIFRGQTGVYRWLLDHPDRGVQIWRRLGAQCTDIFDRGDGRFAWTDNKGSQLTWSTVYRDERLRVWYAEGNVSPGLLLPAVPVRSVAILRSALGRDAVDRPLIVHDLEVFIQTDSKTAALIARLLGASAPRLAKICAGQMEFFFSGLVWYLDRHPDRAAPLLLAGLPPDSPAAREIRQVLAR